MKKVFALVLALAMILAAATAFAGTIALKDVIEGETYTAYKILNYTEGDPDEKGVKPVSYYLTAEQYTAIGSVLEAAGFAFTASADGTQYTLNNANAIVDEEVDLAATAAYLGEHTDDLGNAIAKATATGNSSGEASFTNLDAGYYFVTSSAGSLCALHSDQDIVKAVEKNTVPTQPRLSAKGSLALKQLLVADRAMEGTSLPVSFIKDPPKKLPKPTPKVVMARPVTF